MEVEFNSNERPELGENGRGQQAEALGGQVVHVLKRHSSQALAFLRIHIARAIQLGARCMHR